MGGDGAAGEECAAGGREQWSSLNPVTCCPGQRIVFTNSALRILLWPTAPLKSVCLLALLASGLASQAGSRHHCREVQPHACVLPSPNNSATLSESPGITFLWYFELVEKMNFPWIEVIFLSFLLSAVFWSLAKWMLWKTTVGEASGASVEA